MIPYLLMAFLYFFVAIAFAVAASFISWQIMPWFNSMVWMRLHFITLGVMTQLVFGVMPILSAKYHNVPRPKMRWDIWLFLNGGIALLLVGMPIVNKTPIIAGGTSIFIATTLLFLQMISIRGKSEKATEVSNGRKFYIAGLGFFLIGILVGTGYFTGWVEPLGIVGDAGEVHIHSNNWGFMSLVFVGFFVDLYPTWTKRPLSNPKAITPIFWMMTLGALALVISPWISDTNTAAVGAFLHTSANIWLLVIAIKPLLGAANKEARTPGIAHVLFSYFWLFAPLSMAPFVIFNIESPLPAAALESTTPQALIYGWLLQFGFAILPYFFYRFFISEKGAELGGTWVSFGLVNVGSVFLWASILILPMRTVLHGTAYALWALAFIPVAIDLWKKVNVGMEKAELAIQN